MILPVYVEPQPVLRQPTAAITEITPEVRELVLNMRDTMHGAHGIGLAAPQVGQSLSAFVVEYQDQEHPADAIPFTAFINPDIIWRSPGKTSMEEGCLSLPGVYGPVKRPKKVTVRYTDLDGKQRELTAEGLLARIIQHELDHLKGILFTDYVPEEKRVFREPPAYLHA